jgi:hypothetical protein
MRVETDLSEEARKTTTPIILLRSVQGFVGLFAFSFITIMIVLDAASGHPLNPWMAVLALAGLIVLLWVFNGMVTWYYEGRHPELVVERFWKDFRAGKRLPAISGTGLSGHYRDGFFYVSLWDKAGFHESPRVVLSIRNGERFIRSGGTGADGSLSEEDRLELEFLRRLKSEQPGPFREVVDLLEGH